MLHAIHQKLLRMDPEDAHNLLTKLVYYLECMPGGMGALAAHYSIPAEFKKPVVWGDIEFPHPIGMAAGFDKQGYLVRFLQALGFAFAEIGTVLPDPQEGSVRPRIVRIPGEHGLGNWMGFNSEGVERVGQNLEKRRRHIKIPLGGSLGKMATTANENAYDDYRKVLEKLYRYVQFLIANVSSPNTPDLRALQGVRYLERLVRALIQKIDDIAWLNGEKPLPLVVKIDPDMEDGETLETVSAVHRGGARGISIANTSIKIARALGLEKGGYSGDRLFDRGLRKVDLVHRQFPDMFIIGVNGISSGKRAVEMMQAGANLIQVYTAFIYQGPRIIPEFLHALHRAGF